MATIKAFCGIRYNPAKFSDLSAVITMPYDRIHDAERAPYYELSPFNYVRVIEGYRAPDAPENNIYTRARGYLLNWEAEHVLMRDPRPVLYVLEQTFTTPDGKQYVRRGITAALELTHFDEGIILPHERTLSGPKADRLNMTRATETALEHIFILYPDDENRINALVQPYLDANKPLVVHEQVIEPAVTQAFWAIDDPSIVAAVLQEMAPKHSLIIADGHHRYETALNYREEMRAKYPDAPKNAAFNYVMATFVSMSDPGLVILPTHRLVHSYSTMNSAALLKALAAHFEITAQPDRAALEAAMAQATAAQPRFGFYDGKYALLTLKTLDSMTAIVPDRDPSWRALDVAVLHELILEKVMGLTKESVARKENLDYLRESEQGYAAVDGGHANFLYLLNPTRMEHVRACTVADEKMPQKSTDFYPKVLSGLVAFSLQGTLE